MCNVCGGVSILISAMNNTRVSNKIINIFCIISVFFIILTINSIHYLGVLLSSGNLETSGQRFLGSVAF